LLNRGRRRSADMAQNAGLIGALTPHQKFHQMLRLVAHFHGLNPEEVLDPTHAADVVAARHEVFYRAMRDLKLRPSQVSRITKFHHTTVKYGATRHEQRIAA